MPERPSIPIHPAGPDDEWHIAGIMVFAHPASLDHVRRTIDAMTGAEIHAVSDTGKLVVTVEAPTSHAIVAQLTCLHQLEGVISATLVYQHNEDAAAMYEELPDVSHAS
ncbi:chaperone NapD [Cupriavidus pauculus]|uniref:chaperone NapD n=1 Tax=Cupriavidus pauculus TaxID=82633 RepID=UPI001EE36882|nr:chaperone NapD [Cupriavidus pauculus]GJG97269.1 chaperone NapD [Cupriavidus pauculus]